MLESLPGFNVQANDALGMYEFGNSVSVRAFNFQQIGFLVDGIPLGRSDQFGGSPIYRYVDNEICCASRLRQALVTCCCRAMPRSAHWSVN